MVHRPIRSLSHVHDSARNLSLLIPDIQRVPSAKDHMSPTYSHSVQYLAVEHGAQH
jgi:hypothetical protein